RVVALPTESSERTRASTRRDGELRASRLGRPILRIRESRGRLAATAEQHDEDHGEDPRDGAGELLRSDWIRGTGDVERDGRRDVGTERRVVIVDQTLRDRVVPVGHVDDEAEIVGARFLDDAIEDELEVALVRGIGLAMCVHEGEVRDHDREVDIMAGLRSGLRPDDRYRRRSDRPAVGLEDADGRAYARGQI